MLTRKRGVPVPSRDGLGDVCHTDGALLETRELATLVLDCRPCRQQEKFALRERQVWIGILFPLLRVGSDHHLQCARCWTTYDITKGDAAWLQDPDTDLRTCFES
jgi:hypothetical protein